MAKKKAQPKRQRKARGGQGLSHLVMPPKNIINTKPDNGVPGVFIFDQNGNFVQITVGGINFPA